MIGFTGSPLDRADHLRGDICALIADPAARLLRLDALEPVTEHDRLTWSPLTTELPLAFLGLLDGTPRFVALDPAPPPAAQRSAALSTLLDTLPAADASTYAAARSLVDWHARHGFCANCGTPTLIFRAGWARRCPACAAEHYPRTDAVVIMLAEHSGRVLVGRQPRWPAGRYSALAGFVEVGESIEEAVARELAEEAGVRTIAVRYVASQPWPFPSQLMIACIATVEDDALTLDPTELETAFWATREDVAAALARDPNARFIAPPPYAIAHSLLSAWLKASLRSS